ncbi:MAG: peptidoglycan DD-metalloendopeptidase family protein [Lentimicrobiaceae bacterium]|nr:peptidoglycan DD-metalloendopeptidase family protein [Lentimicrobiaceae bacterium]
MKWKRRLTNIFILFVISGIAYIIIDFFFIPVKTLEEEKIIVAEKTEYGIVVDSLIVVKDVVKSGENLSQLLGKYGVDGSTINEILKKSDTVFDFRKLRAGKPYTIFTSKDSLKKVHYFIYENSDTSYLAYDFRDSMHFHFVERNVEKHCKKISGTITSSLWNAMSSAGADPGLIVNLSEVFAWTIDFYGIQEGDQFKVVYEELSVDKETIGVDKILSAWFLHNGKPYYAFYFQQDDKGDYFDEKGNSMKRAFLKAPLKFSRISSGFSYSRRHPILKIYRPHLGVDYAAPRGTPVYSIGSGTVVSAGFAGGAGRLIKIRHNAVYTTSYMHLSKFAAGISRGTHISQGQVIGYVGSSGLSTGSHLDFRVYKSGSAINPIKMDSPPGKPVKKECFDSFTMLRDKMKLQLDGIKIMK